MRSTRIAVALLGAGIVAALFVGASRTNPVRADADNRIVIRDDCDPTDILWNPTGGCTLRGGDVNVAEFFDELDSPLSRSVVGHQAWRNDPPYLKIETDEAVRVRNRGGRTHTFTKVAEFGGGFVGELNQGLDPAPECVSEEGPGPDPDLDFLPPGAGRRLTRLSAGNNRFQCCIHPWMRALVKVKPEEEEDNDD